MGALSVGRVANWRELQYPEPSWLHAGELKRLASFSSLLRQGQFLAGRWLLRELLAQALGGDPLQQAVDIDAEGRTCLAAGHANLSHSGEWLIAVHAPSPVGIDLERLRASRDLLGLARLVCSPAQRAALVALDGEARLHQFYSWWTLKEAWLKARGQGLDMALMRELDFLPCSADKADACSAILPKLGLALAVHTVLAQPSGLPGVLAGEFVEWQFFKTQEASRLKPEL